MTLRAAKPKGLQEKNYRPVSLINIDTEIFNKVNSLKLAIYKKDNTQNKQNPSVVYYNAFHFNIWKLLY